jgi:hypothetical protein
MEDNYLILDKVESFIRRFIRLPNESDYAVLTLWILHTYFLHKLRTTPRLAIISPEYGCGKSRVLEVLEALSFKGEKLDHFTRSYLFRTIEMIRKETSKSPTLLLDELDTVWGNKSEEGETVRAFVNSGYRDSGFYGITEGEGKNRKPTKFRTFAPVALAGKGEIIPDSVLTRGIILRMQRRAGNEVIEDFLTPDVSLEARDLVEEIEEWSSSNEEEIPYLEPKLSAKDRDREVWLPMFLVAELAGIEWQEKANGALSNYEKIKETNSPTRERQLLTDVWRIFESSNRDTIRSSVLILELIALPDSEWATFNYGKPINERSLSKRLRPYEIKPSQIRFEQGGFKGYHRSEVEQAFNRYSDHARPTVETSETSETKETEGEYLL